MNNKRQTLLIRAFPRTPTSLSTAHGHVIRAEGGGNGRLLEDEVLRHFSVQACEATIDGEQTAANRRGNVRQSLTDNK